MSERLQDIPASVSAVTGDQVDRLSTLADLQSQVSGLTFRAFGPIPAIGVRGFGNRPVAGVATNTAVGVFEDGVFVAPTLVTLINAVDTERVEVAKGPQSTLYGRSTYAGAINLVGNDPTHDFSGYIDGGYGGSSVYGENLYHVRGAISVPLGDTLSVRVFGLHEKRDGFTYDPVTGNRGFGYDRSVGRVRLLWEPSDTVTARLTGTILRDDDPQGSVHSGHIPAPLGQLALFADPFNPAAVNAVTLSHNVWTGIYPTPNSARTSGQEGTLDLRIQTPIGELASLTDYQHSKQELRLSLDLTRLAFATGDTPYEEDRASQEVRLSNKIGGLSYLAGIYILHVNSDQGGGKGVDLAHPFAAFGPGAQLYDLAHFKAIYQPVYTKTDAYAAFGQVGYDFTDRLNLTVGLRYSNDDISGTTGTFFYTTTNVLIPSTPITYRHATFDALTGSANLSYKLTPDVTFYGSYARGNSPGGLNTGGAALINYGEQNVDAFELGVKSRLFDRRLQLNVALFDNQYKKLQFSQNVFINGALTTLTTNTGNAHGRGVDLDAVGILSSNLRVGVQYTYVDSKLTSYVVPPLPAPQVDFTGIPLVRSPKHSVNGSVTFQHDLGPGKIELTAEETYSSSYINDYQGVPAGFAYPGIPGTLAPGITATQVLALYRTPGYALTNLNTSYSWKNWQISAYVRNLFNHQYIGGVVAFDTVTYPNEQPGEPRTYEASIRFKF